MHRKNSPTTFSQGCTRTLHLNVCDLEMGGVATNILMLSRWMKTCVLNQFLCTCMYINQFRTEACMKLSTTTNWHLDLNGTPWYFLKSHWHVLTCVRLLLHRMWFIYINRITEYQDFMLTCHHCGLDEVIQNALRNIVISHCTEALCGRSSYRYLSMASTLMVEIHLSAVHLSFPSTYTTLKWYRFTALRGS